MGTGEFFAVGVKGFGIINQKLDKSFVEYHKKNRELISDDSVEALFGQGETVDNLLEYMGKAEKVENILWESPFYFLADILNAKYGCAGFTAFDISDVTHQAYLFYLPTEETKKRFSLSEMTTVFADLLKELGWDEKPKMRTATFSQEMADSLGYCAYVN